MEAAEFWRHLHGASTHFPIALTCAALLVEGAGLLPRGVAVGEVRRQSLWLLGLAAAGALAAVVSGLVRTKGMLAGSGATWSHQAVVWPGFALLLVLAVWRWRAGPEPGRRALGAFVACLALNAALFGAAGFFGHALARVK